jgi:two-component system chemotaxis sensor kinase CheA
VRFTFDADDFDILQGIVEESTEHLKGIEEGILKLETGFDPELVDAVFRALHSIKGVASFADFAPIKDTAHALESLMSDIRKAMKPTNAEITDSLLRGVDILNLVVEQTATGLRAVPGGAPREPFHLEVDDPGIQAFVDSIAALRTALAADGTHPASAEAEGAGAPCHPAADSAFSALLGQMLPDFIDEACEHLETVEQRCVALEGGAATDDLNAVMRAFHSIKGGAGLIASLRDNDHPRDPVALIRRLTHAAETLLQACAGSGRALPPAAVDLVLRAVDMAAALVNELRENRTASACHPEPLIRRLEEAAAEMAGSRGSSALSDPGAVERASSRLAAFANISGQALESMAAIIDSAVPGLPVNGKRVKQYRRALTNLRSSASYMKLEELVAEIETQLELLASLQADRDLVTPQLLGSLRAGQLRLQELTAAAMAGCGGLENVPDDYADKKLGEILLEEGKISPEALEMALQRQRRLGEILVAEGHASPQDVALALTKQQVARSRLQPAGSDARPPAEVAGQSIRVSQEKLDRLMNMIGELLISKNRIFHLAGRIGLEYNLPTLSREVNAVAAEVGRISDELQDAIMSARMVPLRVLFQRYPRTIRDLSQKVGKQVELQVEGEDTELDKSVVEAINDPLVHMLRNAVDHGLETAEERMRLGKPPRGRVGVRAFCQGTNVVIEISDDGRGLNPDEIKFKALRKGLITAEQVEKMHPADAFQLIFAPGFSTRDEVTELSGRGVGMDVVKSNIEKVGGSVSVSSTLHQGTTFTMKIPLSMSIFQGLIVTAAEQDYIISLDTIEETVKIPVASLRSYQDRLLADIRGSVTPLVSLARLLGLGSDMLPTGADARACVVVLRVDGLRFGLLVDGFHNQQEFVVKPLAEELAGLRIYSGATILGDGSVVLILNPSQLLQLHLAGGQEHDHRVA